MKKLDLPIKIVHNILSNCDKHFEMKDNLNNYIAIDCNISPQKLFYWEEIVKRVNEYEELVEKNKRVQEVNEKIYNANCRLEGKISELEKENKNLKQCRKELNSSNLRLLQDCQDLITKNRDLVQVAKEYIESMKDELYDSCYDCQDALENRIANVRKLLEKVEGVE